MNKLLWTGDITGNRGTGNMPWSQHTCTHWCCCISRAAAWLVCTWTTQVLSANRHRQLTPYSITLINMSGIAMVGSCYFDTKSVGNKHLSPNLTEGPLGNTDPCLTVPLLLQPPPKPGHPGIVRIYACNSKWSDVISSDLVSLLLEPVWVSAEAHFNTEGLL